MWEIVRAGGPLMWPIIFCSIVAAAIVLERLWTLQDRRVLPPELQAQVWKLIEANQVNDKIIAALEQNSPLGKLFAAGLANRHRPREILMERLEDTGRHVVYELERFLNSLGTIASISPLLGLLGTVTGIIRSFNAIQSGGNTRRSCSVQRRSSTMAAATIEQKIIGHISGPPARTISHIQVTSRRLTGNSDAASYRRVTEAQDNLRSDVGSQRRACEPRKSGVAGRPGPETVRHGSCDQCLRKEPRLRTELDCQARSLPRG